MAKYLTGRVRKATRLTEDRYQYLSLDQTEPSLGDPPSSVGSPNIPDGQRFQVISVLDNPGERYWVPSEGGLIPGSISVYEEGILVGGANSTTQLDFRGAAIRAVGTQGSPPGVGVTITVSPPGLNHEILFNDDGDFNGASLFVYDNSTVGVASIGIGTTLPTQNLHINGNLRLEKTVYDRYNSPGNPGDILLKDGIGLKWIPSGSVQSGAGGTISEIQFHDSSGLLDGADNFVYLSIPKRVGIGSTLPDRLLDVLGNTRFTGVSTFSDLRPVNFIAGVSTFINNVKFEGSGSNRDILWSRTNNLLEFQDNTKLTLGTDSDIEFYYDGSVGHIKDTGVSGISSIHIESDILELRNANGSELYLKALNNETVSLYYANLKKLETQNNGVLVYGTLSCDVQNVRDQTNTNINATGIITTNRLYTPLYADLGITTATQLTVDGQAEIQNLDVTGVGTYIDIEIGDVTISQTNSEISTKTGTLNISATGGNVEVNVPLIVDNETQSEFYTGGASIIKGGIGVAKNINVGGAMSVAGSSVGVGVTLNALGGITTAGGDVYIGGNLYIKDEVEFDKGRVAMLMVTGIATFSGAKGDWINIDTTGYGVTVGFGSDTYYSGSGKAIFGAGNEMSIYQQSENNSVITTNADQLQIVSEDILLKGITGNERYFAGNIGAGVTLFFNNVKRFETLNDGSLVSGVFQSDGLHVTSASGISTFAGDIQASRDLDVDGHTFLDNLSVSGISTFDQKVFITGNLVTQGDGGTGIAVTLASAGGITTTGGDLYIGGSLYVGKDVINDNSAIFKTLTITGFSTFKDDVEFWGLAGAAKSAYWDQSDGALRFNDGIKAEFGDAQELKIYHGFDDKSTIASGDIQLTNADASKIYLSAANGQGVDIKYDDSTRLTTTDGGILVSGVTTTKGLSVSSSNITDILDGDIVSDGGNDTIFKIYNSENSGQIDFATKDDSGTSNTILSLVSSAATFTGNIDPEPTGNYNIGSASNKWNKIYAQEIIAEISSTQDDVNITNLFVSGISTFQGPVEIDTDNTANPIVATRYNEAGDGGATLFLQHSKSNTIGTKAALSVDDEIGSIEFRSYASDDTSIGRAARIGAIIDAAPTTTKVKSALVFETSNAGISGTADERLRITSDGHVGIGTDDPIGIDALKNNSSVLAVGLVTAKSVVVNSGSGDDAGLLFPRDPGGGNNDEAYIKFYAETGENTKLLIANEGDPSSPAGPDDIELKASGPVTVSNTAESTSKDTGAFIVEGGVGIELDLFVGGNVNATKLIGQVQDSQPTLSVDDFTAKNLKITGIGTFNGSWVDYDTTGLGVTVGFGSHTYYSVGAQAIFGDNLTISHGGPEGNANISNSTGWMNFFAGGEGFSVLNSDSTKNFISAQTNGHVNLYYETTKRLITESFGITVGGGASISSGLNLGNSYSTLNSPEGSIVSAATDKIFGIYNVNSNGITKFYARDTGTTDTEVLSINVSTGITATGNISPGGSNYDLGASNNRWDTVYANEFDVFTYVESPHVNTQTLRVSGISTFHDSIHAYTVAGLGVSVGIGTSSPFMDSTSTSYSGGLDVVSDDNDGTNTLIRVTTKDKNNNVILSSDGGIEIIKSSDGSGTAGGGYIDFKTNSTWSANDYDSRIQIIRNSTTHPHDGELIVKTPKPDQSLPADGTGTQERLRITRHGILVTGVTSTTDLSVSGSVKTNLTPAGTVDLGTTENPWNDLYVSKLIGVGDVETDELTVVSLSVTGFSTFTKEIDANSHLNVAGVSTFTGIVTTSNDLYVGGALRPSPGNTDSNGIFFSSLDDDATDKAFIRYYSEGETDSKLHIGSINDGLDDLYLESQLVHTSNNFTVGANLVVTTNVDSNLIPYGTRDLGTSENPWDNVYANNVYGQTEIDKQDFEVVNLKVTGIGTFNQWVDFNTTSGLSTLGFGSHTYYSADAQAIFGADSDLSIYSDSGGDSYITETGTGSLHIRTSTLNVQNHDGTKNLITASATGSVELYYQGTTGDGVKFGTIQHGALLYGGLGLGDSPPTPSSGDILSDGGSDGIWGIKNTTNNGELNFIVKSNDGTESTILNLKKSFAYFTGNVSPTTNEGHDLGDSESHRWNNVYAKNVTAANLIGEVEGNADSADKLSTARNIEITGDITWNVDFDGSGNVSAASTLPNVNVLTEATEFGDATNVAKITVNPKGLITAVEDQAIDFGNATVGKADQLKIQALTQDQGAGNDEYNDADYWLTFVDSDNQTAAYENVLTHPKIKLGAKQNKLELLSTGEADSGYLYAAGKIESGDKLTVSGTATFNGSATFGNNVAADTVSFEKSLITSNFVPTVDGSNNAQRDLGTSDNPWATLHVNAISGANTISGKVETAEKAEKVESQKSNATANSSHASDNFITFVNTNPDTYTAYRTFTSDNVKYNPNTGLFTTKKLKITSDAEFDGDVTIGADVNDKISFTSKVNTNIIPLVNNDGDTPVPLYNLGSSSNKWKDLHVQNLYAETSTDVSSITATGLIQPSVSNGSGDNEHGIIWPQNPGTGDSGDKAKIIYYPTADPATDEFVLELGIEGESTTNNTDKLRLSASDGTNTNYIDLESKKTTFASWPVYFNDDVHLGNAAEDEISIDGRIKTDILPVTAATTASDGQGLGSDAQRWDSIFCHTITATEIVSSGTLDVISEKAKEIHVDFNDTAGTSYLIFTAGSDAGYYAPEADTNLTYDQSTDKLTLKNLTVNDNTILGASTADQLNIKARVHSDIIPDRGTNSAGDGKYDLGSEAYPWDNIYANNITGVSNAVINASSVQIKRAYNANQSNALIMVKASDLGDNDADTGEQLTPIAADVYVWPNGATNINMRYTPYTGVFYSLIQQMYIMETWDGSNWSTGSQYQVLMNQGNGVMKWDTIDGSAVDMSSTTTANAPQKLNWESTTSNIQGLVPFLGQTSHKVYVHDEDENNCFVYNPNDGGQLYLNRIQVALGDQEGDGIRFANDGDIANLQNGYCNIRFSKGLYVHSSAGSLGNSPNNWKIELSDDGYIKAKSDITAYSGSDIRLKENIRVIKDPISKILKLRGVNFDWKDEYLEYKGGEDGYFVRKGDVGVIAQEVEKVLPEVVATREDNEDLSIKGVKAVKYEKMVPLLIEAIKEQQATIEDLKSRLEKLEG